VLVANFSQTNATVHDEIKGSCDPHLLLSWTYYL